MTHGPVASSDGALTDARTLLERRWDTPIALIVVERMRPHVWRAEVGVPELHADVSRPTGIPASVIVRVGPDRLDGPPAPGIGWAAAFANEWAGSLFLDGLSEVTDAVPQVLAHDLDAQVLVTEDLGRGPSLATLLTSDDADAAVAALSSHAGLLGRIAAETRDRTDGYRKIRARAGEVGRASLLDELRSDELRAVLPRWDDELAVSPPAGLEAELDAIDRETREPGAWAAYSPADACPDNNVVVDGQVRIFDLGFGGVRHLALDAAYAVIPFPTCWCYAPLPAGVSDRMQTAFRAEVARALPEAGDDDVWAQKLAWACAAWFVGFIATVVTR
jgi:hypothetical protein